MEGIVVPLIVYKKRRLETDASWLSPLGLFPRPSRPLSSRVPVLEFLVGQFENRKNLVMGNIPVELPILETAPDFMKSIQIHNRTITAQLRYCQPHSRKISIVGLFLPPQRPHLRESLDRVSLILGTNQALAQHPRDTLLH